MTNQPITMRATLLTAAILAGSAAQCAAQTFTLIKRDLSRNRVHGPLFGAEAVHFAGADGQPILVPRDDLLVLLADEPSHREPPEGSLGEEPIGMLTLTDGRRLYGRAIETQGDTLGWETILRDRLEFAFEDVRSIVASATKPVRPGETLDDRVVLENGDELTGFVLGYRPTVEIETDAGVRTIEPQLVRGVVLANPPTRSASPLVALADGSVLACSRITSNEQGDVLLADADTAAEMLVTSDELVGVLWQPASVVGLTSLPNPRVSPGAELGWIDPPRTIGPDLLGVGDLRFAGPARVTWPLPEGAVSFSAMVELPASTRPWGECEVVVLIASPAGEREVASVWLDPDHPTGELRADLAGVETLTIVVREGKLGPVADTPLLRAPVLLLGRQ